MIVALVFFPLNLIRYLLPGKMWPTIECLNNSLDLSGKIPVHNQWNQVWDTWTVLCPNICVISKELLKVTKIMLKGVPEDFHYDYENNLRHAWYRVINILACQFFHFFFFRSTFHSNGNSCSWILNLWPEMYSQQ